MTIMSSNKNSFMVTTTPGIVLKGRGIGKVEDHCLEGT